MIVEVNAPVIRDSVSGAFWVLIFPSTFFMLDLFTLFWVLGASEGLGVKYHELIALDLRCI